MRINKAIKNILLHVNVINSRDNNNNTSNKHQGSSLEFSTVDPTWTTLTYPDVCRAAQLAFNALVMVAY